MALKSLSRLRQAPLPKATYQRASSRRMVLVLTREDLVFYCYIPEAHPSQGLVEALMSVLIERDLGTNQRPL